MPWLWAPHLAQGLFLLGLTAYWKALTTHSRGWFALTGVLLGVTFLFHTAAALILGLTVLLSIWVELRENHPAKGRRQAVLRTLGHGMLAASVAILASLPYTLPIILKYQFQVLNVAPSVYRDGYLTLSSLPVLLLDLLTPSNAIAMIGVYSLLQRPRWEPHKAILLAWPFVAVAFMAYSYAWQRWPSLPPQIMPAHHFMISLSLWKAIAFAMGIMLLVRWARAMGARAMRHRKDIPELHSTSAGDRDPAGIPARVGVAIVFILMWTYVPGYRAYTDFKLTWNLDIYESVWDLARFEPVHDWLLRDTTTDDVFLTDNLHVEMKAVLPAGRKLVAATLAIFMNPYVDCQTRSDDRQSMLDALESGDHPCFIALADKYRVSHVILDKARLQPPQPDFLEPVFETGDFAVSRVRRDK